MMRLFFRIVNTFARKPLFAWLLVPSLVLVRQGRAQIEKYRKFRSND